MPDVATARIAGADRIDTAVQVVAQRLSGSNDTVPAVLLARAGDFPDALAGGGLASAVEGIAGVADAPVLLTHSDRLPDATAQALQDLGVREVVLLGGPAAISPQVEQQLDLDHDVRRVAGTDRYATAAEAARTLVRNNDGLGTIDGATHVILANGLDFADALAAGPVAYSAQIPVLLTAPDRLPAATRAILQELDPDRAIVVGGEQAVSDRVATSLESDYGIVTQRLAGPDRQATATAIADFALDTLGYDGQEAVLVRGNAFPDALSAAPHAGRLAAPVLLTQDADTLTATTANWLAAHCSTLRTVHAVGGPNAVSPEVLQRAEQAAETCVGGEDQLPPFTAQPSSNDASAGAMLTVADVRVGAHEGFDRVVFDLGGTGAPGWHVEYRDTVNEQGTGREVQLEGAANLRVLVRGTVSPLSTDARYYDGPDRVDPTATANVEEIYLGTWFEGTYDAAMGLQSQQPFRVFHLQNPDRLVIDVLAPS